MVVSSLIVLLALAQSNPLTEDTPPGAPTDVVPQQLQNVEVVEHLGDTVPLDLPFVDSMGRKVQLKDYFDGVHPVVFTLSYYRCKMLCGLVLSGTAKTLKKTGFTLGNEYKALTVSINPQENAGLAAEAQRGTTAPLVSNPDQAKNWAFLVTENEQNVRKLADAVGFKYAYDAETQQFAHAAVIFVLSPKGKISRYFYGMEWDPKDMRLALVEAADGKVGTTLDKVLLTCYHFDPATRKYGLFLSRFLRGGALAVFLALGAMLGLLWRREFKKGQVS